MKKGSHNVIQSKPRSEEGAPCNSCKHVKQEWNVETKYGNGNS